MCVPVAFRDGRWIFKAGVTIVIMFSCRVYSKVEVCLLCSVITSKPSSCGLRHRVLKPN